MHKRLLFLDAPGGGYIEDWLPVEQAIRTVFERGDGFRLEIRIDDGDPRGPGLADMISMRCLPGQVGQYRLVVFPAVGLNEKFKIRTWWGVGAFRGTVRDSYDDVWDARTVCTDVNVALELFKEFFEHKDVSQRIIDATISDWDAPKPE